MALVTQNIGDELAMGANIVDGGVSFRLWAPRATDVRLIYNNETSDKPESEWAMKRLDNGHWVGFLPNAQDGDKYRFYVEGDGYAGPKRDPYSRELEWYGYPDCDSIVRDPNSYLWIVQNFKRRPFHEWILYQIHVGTFYSVDETGEDNRIVRKAKFLDIIHKIKHLADLGITAVQLMPIIEYQSPHSMGYNGTDMFSPEMDLFVPKEELADYVHHLNALLAQKGKELIQEQLLYSGVNQLKLLIDILHLFDIGVFFDVVYNHAGEFGNNDISDQSIFYIDRPLNSDNENSLYFMDEGWAGGMVFKFHSAGVRQFLIDNAKAIMSEYRVDAIRYDEVTVIIHFGGWEFCQDLMRTLHYIDPSVMQVAEYWSHDKSWILKSRNDDRAGFDAVWFDLLRDAIRKVVEESSHGSNARVNMDSLRDAMNNHFEANTNWQIVNYIENHDLHKAGHHERVPRIPALADSSNTRSWYARSRSRVAMGLLMTAPGIPMIFMGQEFLEDKFWSDNPDYHKNALIWWDGLEQQDEMKKFYGFTGEIIKTRKKLKALTAGNAINIFHTHNDQRIIAFQRWIENVGEDVVVVVSLNENARYHYKLGFPSAGSWKEVFNSDAYDDDAHSPVGNNGHIEAHWSRHDGLPASASINIPPNGFVIFQKSL